MRGWAIKTVGELCDSGSGEVQTGPFGSQLHESDYSVTGTPVIMPKDILDGRIDETNIARVSDVHVDRLRRHKLSKGDIVYGRRGDIGRQALVREGNVGWLCGTGCLRIRLGASQVVPLFLHRYLKLPAVIRWIEGQAIGATMLNLNTNILRRLPVTFPHNMGVQQRIAAILETYDELIENNRQRIALLERLAEEIYREWFVRLRFPCRDAFKKVNGLPQGWTLKSSSKVFRVMSGGTPHTDNPAYWDGDIFFFTPKDAGDSFYVLTTERAITQKGLDSCNSRLFCKDTIFITARGTVGKVCLAYREMAMNQTCYALAPIEGGDAYFHFLSMKNAIAYVKGVSKSGVFDNIVVDTFKVIPILVPPEALILKFNKYIAPVFKQIGALLHSSEWLTKTRDLLLPRLISGRLSVEALDIQFPPGMTEELGLEETLTAHA